MTTAHKIPKLCLNMIVKNESLIIRRLLESVSPYIDAYCICDTGSTDDTVEHIRSFFEEKQIPGKVVVEPFRDFGYNRAFALKQCDDFPEIDYVLLLDADMTFWVNPAISADEFKEKLTKDAYHIYQGSETFFNKNVRIVRNHANFSYWGVTHEYVKSPENAVYGSLEKTDVFINDIGDGGCKTNKFVRDIQLLTKGLEDTPNNDRYTFYLANTYRDIQQHDKAIEYYKKRIELGGWFEEIWYSYYSIGKCYSSMGDIPNAIHHWMEAYQYFPNRIENLYEIVRHYRTAGKNNLAYPFYVIAFNERKKNPKWDYLFLQKDIYDFKLDFEFSIIGYYCNHAKFNMPYCCMKVISDPNVDDGSIRNVLSNYKFYSQNIKEWHSATSSQNLIEILESVGQTLAISSNPDFYSSTPSVCIHQNRIIVNLRYVNYRIDDKGGYVQKEKIETVNAIAIIEYANGEWTKIKEFVLDYNKTHDGLYVGLEDIRLHSAGDCNNELLFNANRGLGVHQISIEHGEIDLENQETNSGFLKMDGQGQIEKNWVLFTVDGVTRVVYNWSPLVIGDIVHPKDTVSASGMGDMQFVKTHEIKVPTFFKHLRGSTNGVVIGDEIWFICHSVSYEDRRYYYHLFVVLDKSTLKLKKYTPYFTFEKAKVEYTLGFSYLESTNQLLIGYSVMDSSTHYISVNKSHFDNMALTLNV